LVKELFVWINEWFELFTENYKIVWLNEWENEMISGSHECKWNDLNDLERHVWREEEEEGKMW